MTWFAIFHTTFGCTGIFLNLLLCYLAIFKSPPSIKTYSTLILNFAVTDLLGSFMDTVVQQRIIPAGLSLLFMPEGVCTYLGVQVCNFAFSLYLHTLSHSLWSLLLSFSYRYYILHHPSVKISTLFKIIFLIYLPSFYQALTYWTEFREGPVVEEIMEERYPDYNITGKVLTGIPSILSFNALYCIIHLSFPVFPIYCCVGVLRRRIVGHLQKNARSMTKDTRKMHSQLLWVLSLQALLPMFLWVASSTYLLQQLEIIKGELYQRLVFSLALLFPVAGPLTYIVFVRPYRTFCENALLRIVNPRKAYETKNMGKFASNDATSKTGYRSSISAVHPIQLPS